jgi:anti-sigma factor RsiW
MTRCPSADVLVDLVLDGPEASSEAAAHAEACPRCHAELEALGAVVHALHAARRERIPEAWRERVLARVRKEAEAPVRRPILVRMPHAARTMVLASVTVLAAVAALAPGGVGSPGGVLAYSVLLGGAAAAGEALKNRWPGRWTLD